LTFVRRGAFRRLVDFDTRRHSRDEV
jgi:hypothetical protein